LFFPSDVLTGTTGQCGAIAARLVEGALAHTTEHASMDSLAMLAAEEPRLSLVPAILR